MTASYSKSKARKGSGGFITIPHVVLDSESYCMLSGNALKVLMAIYHQYKGGNNGDLCAPFSYAKKYRIASETTWYKSIKELIAADLILCTRDPIKLRNNAGGQCSLYAVTWRPINECKGKIDVSATTTPPRKFSLEKKA
jgi:hypothetical protein